MKVAIDTGSVIGERAFGIGINTKHLIEGMAKEAKKRKNFQVESFSFFENRKKLEKGIYDIVHYPYFHPFFLTLPSKKYAKVVVTIHDLIPLVYPKQYPAGLKGKLRFMAQKNRLKSVDAFLTISETSKKDIVRFLNVSPEKVHAIHIAPSPVFKKENDRKMLNRVVAKYNLPNKFVLYLGDVYYSKNIPTLIMACRYAKIPLVIVGKQATEVESNLETDLKKIKGPRDWIRFLTNRPHPELSHYRLLKEMFESEGEVIRLGYVPDSDLIPIMNLATVYCQPSYYEGFGLGVVHAFACGVPVVISKTQALVEISGDAALIADPFNPKDMSSKISILLDNPSMRAQFIRKGNERLKKYSWEKTANLTLKVYEKVLDK
jgi:glycosyltransferase involved in cell wall biosynthesis